VLQCRTHKLRPRDYPVVFSSDQWARLAAFPDGVCNYDKEGGRQAAGDPVARLLDQVGGKRLGEDPE
jgi:hypothetical protein